MQRVWQWFRDKKTNTIRKWRSSVFGGRRAESGTFDPFDQDGRYFPSRPADSTYLLSPPTNDYDQLRQIGGSDSVLQRNASRSKRALQKLQRRLTPTRSQNGRASTAKTSTSGEFDSRREDANELKQLLLEEDDPYESRSSFDYASRHPSNSTPDDLSVNLYDTFGANSSGGNSPNNNYGSRTSMSGVSVSNERAGLPPTPKTKRSAMAGRWSLASSPQLSTPASTRVQRRRLRFVIPQVSLSSDDPNASTQLLFDSQESLVPEMSAETTLSSPGAQIPESPSSTRGGYSPTPARRISELEKRRMSLAQRRQSNTQQLISSASGRRTSTTMVPLTTAQIHLIRTLWRQVYASKGPTVIGETVIHRLFFKHPKLKEQFLRCAPPRNFPNRDSFSKFHSKAMGELVDQVVENLEDLTSVCEQLEKIGRAHAQILNGQLSSKLWNNVAETFIDCTLEWGDRRCRSETVRKAWALIIAFIAEKIKHGHLDQRKQMLTMKSTIASLERVALADSSPRFN
ncbi:hypothetical protein M3Y94_00524700 [Aphelenchoides besseyi]|nr:hypothetical protein M3Y94_00524700 [Aphelenchoides besseyi]KAI6225939.1 Globin [Aphelenchoides besseyi]